GIGHIGSRLLFNEDIDFFERVRATGVDIAYEPAALVHHHIDPERVSRRWLVRRGFAQGESNALLAEVRGQFGDGDAARAARRAVFSRLVSPNEYRAEAPWNDFLSGQSARRRRHWGRVTFDPLTYDAYQRGASPFDPFYAFGPSRTVIAFDVPKTTPSDAVYGPQVISWGAHDPAHVPSARPAELLDVVLEAVGGHPAVAIVYS